MAETHACIMHPSLLANETFEYGPTEDYDVVDYGLCNLCIKSLSASNEYKKEIDLEIEKRLKTLTKMEN